MEFTKSSAVERFCRDALAQHARLFRLWHKFRGGQIDRSQLLLRSIPIQKRIFALAERHLDSPHREVRNLATALFEHNDRLFTFLEEEGVEPTNNSVERALRTGVQWRKICFGTQSRGGSRFVERILSAVGTCRAQSRPILDYLREVWCAVDSGREIPSLLARVDPGTAIAGPTADRSQGQSEATRGMSTEAFGPITLRGRTFTPAPRRRGASARGTVRRGACRRHGVPRKR